MPKSIESTRHIWYNSGMKDEVFDINAEELTLPDVPADEGEILSGDDVFHADLGEMETLEEVHADVDEEIVVGDVATAEDWHRAVKHLNARIGELEMEIAQLRRLIEELKKGE